MKESLQITLNENDHAEYGGPRTWNVTYHAHYDTPAGADPDKDIEGGESDWATMDPSEDVIEDCSSLANAVRRARAWAAGSGFKVTGTRIGDYGNVVTLGLKRP